MTRPRKTLEPEQVATRRLPTRRAALSAIATTSAAALALVLPPALGGRAAADATDSDRRDRPGRGRTGHTDRDAGPHADGVGRGVCPERGWTDSDPSDPAGRGRGPCH